MKTIATSWIQFAAEEGKYDALRMCEEMQSSMENILENSQDPLESSGARMLLRRINRTIILLQRDDLLSEASALDEDVEPDDEAYSTRVQEFEDKINAIELDVVHTIGHETVAKLKEREVEELARLRRQNGEGNEDN